METEKISQVLADLRRDYRSTGIESLMTVVSKQIVAQENAASEAASSGGLAARVAALEHVVEALTRHYEIRDEGYASECGVTAEGAFEEADGFHKLEYTNNGLAYRWTGPTPSFKFVLFLDRSRRLETALNLCKFSLGDGMTVRAYVDGALAKWDDVRVGEAVATHLLKLPKLERNRHTVLQFEASRVWSPR